MVGATASRAAQNGLCRQVVDSLASAFSSTLEEATDVPQAFRDLARRFLDGLLQPDALRLRRLVLAEADRFPDISAAWFEGAFDRVAEVFLAAYGPS